MDEGFGWRAKIGLIVNSGQVITEPLYHRLSPPGVSFYASRILVEGRVIDIHESMETEAFRAARELTSASVDCIAYCCTVSGILQGIEGDRAFCLRMTKETGIPTISTLSAVVESLEFFRIKNLVLVSPYDEETHSAEEKFFEANGYPLVGSHSMEITSRKKRVSTPPGEIYRFCMDHWDKNADGLLISCMNFNAMPCAASLERDLGKPVLTSHSATFWKALRMVGVREPISGYGRLLDQGLSAS